MSIAKKIELARLELLDMGLRGNPLLNYKSTIKTLDVFDEVPYQVFDILVEQNKDMRLSPIPKAYLEENDLEANEKQSLPPLEPALGYFLSKAFKKSGAFAGCIESI